MELVEKYLPTVPATLQAALELKPPLNKEMVIFIVYSNLKVKFIFKNLFLPQNLRVVLAAVHYFLLRTS